MIYMGIDPGASGGIALLDMSGVRTIMDAVPMPGSNAAILDQLSKYIKYKETVRCAIENVFARPGDGRSSLAKFMINFGGLLMALEALKIPFIRVQPAVWQKSLGIPKRDKEENKTQFKKRLKAVAQSLYPRIKVTEATQDALLLATYCQRINWDRLYEEVERNFGDEDDE